MSLPERSRQSLGLAGDSPILIALVPSLILPEATDGKVTVTPDYGSAGIRDEESAIRIGDEM